MRIKMYGKTHQGMVRKINQDAIYFSDSELIAVVADGLGGRESGEVASTMAIESLKRSFLDIPALKPSEIGPFLSASIDKLNLAIFNQGRKEQQKRSMGTTLVTVIFGGGKIHIAHVGDSRCYLYLDGNLWQLTLDHNIQTFLERGDIDPRKLNANVKKGALMRAIGLQESCEIDILDKKMLPNEIYLICSDGLTNMVSDRKILQFLRRYERKLDQLPEALVDEANNNGGKDNISVIVAKVGQR